MIVGLYIFSPIITTWLHNAEIYEIEYFLIVWALISFVGFSNVDFLLYDYLKYSQEVSVILYWDIIYTLNKNCFKK